MREVAGVVRLAHRTTVDACSKALTILSMAPGGRRPFSCSNRWIALILRASESPEMSK